METRDVLLHKVNSLNEKISVTAYDNVLGAEHPTTYAVDWPGRLEPLLLSFQVGAMKQVGINGLTNEVLLAVLIDRLTSFQAGSTACDENRQALLRLHEARLWLHKRTFDRASRRTA